MSCVVDIDASFAQGLTLVISPLIALMKDQVDALVARKINAAALDSTQSVDRISWIKNEVTTGAMKILYVAPERYVHGHHLCAMAGWNEVIWDRLNNEGFMALMKRVKISLLAVDESHCISQVRIQFPFPSLVLFPSAEGAW